MYEFFSDNSPIRQNIPVDFFAEKLRDSYFKGKKDIESSGNSFVRRDFYQLRNLIFQYPESDNKRALTKKILNTFAKKFMANDYYQVIDEKKQDLKTFAFEIGANDLGIALLKKEKELKERAERNQRNNMARWGERYDDDDDTDQTDEPQITELEDPATLMLMMYGSNGISFVHQDKETKEWDLAGQLIKEFKIKPHDVVSVKLFKNHMGVNCYGQTTPFMYFLANHDTWGDRRPHPYFKIPPLTDKEFYEGVDLDFKDFQGRQIFMDLLHAGLTIHSTQFLWDHIQISRAEHDAKYKELPIEPEPIPTAPDFVLEQEVVQKKTPQTKDTRKKPRVISRHKRKVDTETQNLFEKGNE